MLRRLFLDDAHVSEAKGVRRCAHRAEKYAGNPVVTREYDWEKAGIQLYGRSVIFDPSAGLFRMYYLAYKNAPTPGGKTFELNGVTLPSNALVPAYAESRDGIHWSKPFLNQCKIDGVDADNVIDVLCGQSFEPGVLYDADDPDAGRRYKMMYWGQRCQFSPVGKMSHPGGYWDGRLVVEDERGKVIWDRPNNPDTQQFGMYIAFSGDGVNWELYSRGPVFTTYSDTGHSVLRDPRSGKYVAFGRFRFTRNCPGFDIYRNVARVQSDDFINWSDPELVLAADSCDPHDTHINSVNVDLYEGMYIALMEIGDGRKPAERPSGPMQLAVSHDGYQWTRVADRFGFLDSSDPNDWDYGGHIKPGTALIVYDDKVHMYYGGAPAGEFRSGFGLATWRRDGFVSMRADETEGLLISKGLVIEGRELHLNVSAAHGRVEVQVAGPQGDLPPGWEPLPESEVVAADSTDVVVRWKGEDLSKLQGRLISLRFRMQKADLYSFWFAD